MRLLALRFDVDSITCIEKGIPPLRRLADELGVRFTFFVNMGYSFNWAKNLQHAATRLAGRRKPPRGEPGVRRSALPASRKMGVGAVLRTIAFNPRLGDRYRHVFDELHADGHELGLHGGTDHVVWQRSLHTLTSDEVEELFRPAFESFSERYGAPAGFASPGFEYDQRVLDLLDREGFLYGSDMGGEAPFQPRSAVDDATHAHFQIPVNVIGDGRVPVIEQGIARGLAGTQIADEAAKAVQARNFAVMYGHPYVEGVRADILGDVLHRVRDSHEVVTMKEYLTRWKQAARD